MEENKDTYPQSSKKEPNDTGSPNENIHSLTTTIHSLSAELDEVRKSLQKRKSENTTLKILFYTGLLVLLVGFLYSNSVLQRAHMRSLEKNIISLEESLIFGPFFSGRGWVALFSSINANSHSTLTI